MVTKQEKVLATKLDYLSSIPETYEVEEERTKPTPRNYLLTSVQALSWGKE